ncbi:putative glucuronosyltransferase [Panicum miliaceum]|uniref:Glucuronosyltransferase n=1 Tax=Panicum miliaceum TaxID=4540 RepID=A0A3L6SUU5_PANMI|nr:putative glucuronosyltransferase [Panicum miliaceum]
MNAQVPSLSKTRSQEHDYFCYARTAITTLALAPALLKFGVPIYWMQATIAEVEYIKNEKRGVLIGGRRKLALLLSAESSSFLHLSPASRELAASVADWWVLPKAVLHDATTWRDESMLCGPVIPSMVLQLGSAGDVLEDNPIGRLKVYVYDLPSKYNKKLLKKDPRCLNHMFAAEIFMHRFLLSSAVRTFNPEEADWFYTPVYTTCDLTPSGLPLPFKSPRMMRSAIQLIATNWPYWNRSEGADHFFVTPHDFGACFHYQEEKAIGRGILPLLQRATLVQTFGQKNHVCLKDGSITIPPFAPPQKMQTHLIPPDTPRSIFVYFRGLFYDTGNDPEGGYYARGARASVWENFKNNPLFDISTDHPPTYYEDMQRSVFCLCPLGWAPWSPRLVEAVVFGCIPVIIADDIVLPFADAIPWEEIGVFVAEEDVPRLDSILTSIPTDVILRKQRLLANPSMKQAMLFPQPAQPGDAFHQILNGLARKLPHGDNVFLKPGERILNWTAGPPGDLKPW